MKVIDDDDASLLPKIGADGFPLRGTVTRARDYSSIQRLGLIFLVEEVKEKRGRG